MTRRRHTTCALTHSVMVNNMVNNSRPTRRADRAADRFARTYTPPSLACMLFLAAALFALALPVIGPLNDHHFSERSHNHDHIYLNGVPVAHEHAYEGSARHAHPDGRPEYSRAALGEPPADIVYLAPTRSGLTLVALNAPYHLTPDSLRPPPPTNAGNLLQRFDPGSVRVRGASVAPPSRPPVA